MPATLRRQKVTSAYYRSQMIGFEADSHDERFGHSAFFDARCDLSPSPVSRTRRYPCQQDNGHRYHHPNAPWRPSMGENDHVDESEFLVHSPSFSSSTSSSSSSSSACSDSDYDRDCWDLENQLEQERCFVVDSLPKFKRSRRKGGTIQSFPSLQKLSILLPLKLLNLDRVKAWLVFYVQFTSSSANQEKVLKVLQWSLWMLGASLGGNRSNIAGEWLIKLSCDVCYARYVTRILGLPSAIEGALSGSWACTSSRSNGPNGPSQTLDQMYHAVGTLLACLMIAYYPTELMAFALWMKPSGQTAAILFHWSADTWFVWSMRFWLAYVVVDLFQSVVQYWELQTQRIELVRSMSANKVERATSSDRTSFLSLPSDLSSQLRLVIRQHHDVSIVMVCNGLYLLPCLYWSALLPPFWNDSSDATMTFATSVSTSGLSLSLVVHTLMWMESIVCLHHGMTTA